MPDKRIVLLAGKLDTTPIVYNFLKEHFHIEMVLLEDPVPRKEFLRKRMKKLGWIRVGGQVLFQILIGKPLSKISQKRINEILKDYALSVQPIPSHKTSNVSSVNSDDCLKCLQQLQAQLVVVHGTRIISKKILAGTDAVFLNIHAGITPRYRGSHGAYWALANNDEENCGVTVHIVDGGIDTGNILFQEKIPITPKDNFATYGYLQLSIGLQLLKKAIDHFYDSNLVPVKAQLNSALWHHPTLWGYCYKRLFRKVK